LLVNPEEVDMNNATVIWIIALAVVLVAIVATVLFRTQRRSRVDHKRTEAREIRQQADSDRIAIQRREAEVAKVDAAARMAQAEADLQATDAALLQTQAQERSENARVERSELNEKLRTADEIDPDVPSTTGRDDNFAGDRGGRTNPDGFSRAATRDGRDRPRAEL